MALREILTETENQMQKAFSSTRREFSEVHSGRANPHMAEGIRVDYYGTPTLLKELATINIPDAKLIVIRPYDPGSISAIEKAILKSNIGITPTNDGKVVRLSVPALSEERREELIKIVKDMAEKGKVSLRTMRHTAIENAKNLEQDKVISEDELFRTKDKVQEVIDKYTKLIDEALENKIKELRES